MYKAKRSAADRVRDLLNKRKKSIELDDIKAADQKNALPKEKIKSGPRKGTKYKKKPGGKKGKKYKNNNPGPEKMIINRPPAVYDNPSPEEIYKKYGL